MSDNGKDIRRALKAAAQTPKKPNPYKDDVDYISMMGYRDDSPFNNRPYIDINTPNGMIDMSATGIPLYANGRYLPPYSGMHQFEPGIVREQRIPTAQYGNAGMRGMMKARMAYANEFGNPSAKRMVSPSPSDYTFTGNEFDAWKGKPTGVLAGESGTHYMGAFDNYAVPFIQENQGKLGFKSRPDTRDAEAMRFENPEEALYFSENYKDIAPMMRNWEKKEGGWLDELDEDFKRGGPVNPLMLSRSKRRKTSKNIQSSINKLFLRNRDLFGPGGKNIYDPKSKYQEGAQVNEDQQFLIDMANSPLFPERYARMTGQQLPIPYANTKDSHDQNLYYPADQYRKDIINNINTVKYAPIGEGNFGEDVGGYYRHPIKPDLSLINSAQALLNDKRFKKLQPAEYEYLKKEIDAEIEKQKKVEARGHTINVKDSNKTTRLHETSHASTLGDLSFDKPYTYKVNPNLNELWKSLYEKPEYAQYLSKPTEIKARVDVLRKGLKDQGLYDATKGPFTEKDYDKLEEYRRHATMDQVEQGMDLEGTHSKEDFIRMMNDIVSNNPKSQPVAKMGGGLDEYQKAGQLRAVSSTAAIPVSTQAPINPINPQAYESWPEMVSRKWKNRDPNRDDPWELIMPDTHGGYTGSGMTPFDLMLGAPQDVVKTLASKAVKGLPKGANKSASTLKDKVIYPSKASSKLAPELEPYISKINPSREADRFARSTANTVDEYTQNWRNAVQHFDKKGNPISIPEPQQKGLNPGIWDILWDGLLPKTPFNEVPVGNQYYYRKIGNKRGLRDLVTSGTTRQPGTKYEGAFYGWRKPIEDYDGRYAVGYDTKAGTIGMDFCKPGRPGCVGYLPTKKIDINDPALNVYKRKFMSSGYKKLDKAKLRDELVKNYSLQEKAENVLRPTLAWGSRYAVGHDLYYTDWDKAIGSKGKHSDEWNKERGPENRYINRIGKILSQQQTGGGWLDNLT